MSNPEFTAIPVKPCVKCGAMDRDKDGRCRPCHKITQAAWKKKNAEAQKAYNAKRYRETPERQAAASAAWRSANPQKVKDACAAWIADNPEKSKAISATYRINNREKLIAYRVANADSIRARNAKRHKEHPELSTDKKAKRRARVAENGGTLSKGLAKKLFRLQKGKCACCGKPLKDGFHMDHVMPISLGGSNTDENMQLLTAKCNMQKHATHPVDFMQSRGFLI